MAPAFRYRVKQTMMSQSDDPNLQIYYSDLNELLKLKIVLTLIALGRVTTSSTSASATTSSQRLTEVTLVSSLHQVTYVLDWGRIGRPTLD